MSHEELPPPTPEPTGMDGPGAPANEGPEHRAREAVGGRLEETAGRVRELGDRAAARNPILAPTRPLAYDAARGIDNVAHYLRSRELDGMRRDLEAQVRRHPLAAVAAAFLTGYTLRRIFH
ncbi:MAG: hypothetical protein ACOCUW_04455 [Gemmatimonadota bacterium]